MLFKGLFLKFFVPSYFAYIANARDQFKINNSNVDVNDVTLILNTLGAVPKRFRRATKECEMDCSKNKRKPVCGTDREIYRHKCELKRIRRCEGRQVRVIPMGFCTGQFILLFLFPFLHSFFWLNLLSAKFGRLCDAWKTNQMYLKCTLILRHIMTFRIRQT